MRYASETKLEVTRKSRHLVRGQLEAAFLEDVQTRLLTSESVDYVVRRTLSLIEERTAVTETHEANRADLALINRKLGNLVDLAAETGDVSKIGEKIKQLEHRRAQIEHLDAAVGAKLDIDAIATAVRTRASTLRGWFEESGEAARRAVKALLGDRRLDVYVDAHSFRLEAFFELAAGDGDALLPVGKQASRSGGAGDPTRPEHSGKSRATSLRIPIRLEL
jgi:hypothetical protein